MACFCCAAFNALMSAKPSSFSRPRGRMVWPFRMYFAGWAAGRLGVITVVGPTTVTLIASHDPCPCLHADDGLLLPSGPQPLPRRSTRFLRHGAATCLLLSH